MIKKIFLFFLIVFIPKSLAAIATNAVWEIRTTASANNVGGGFYVPGSAGTDYSQQDAPQYNATDLVSANGTTAPCTVTSVTHSFTTADEGNGIHITAGTNWTAGWYQIVSTSGGSATLDRACGTAAALAAGTYYVGGAISLGNVATAGSTDQLVFTSNPASGSNIYYVKSGNYTSGTVTAAATCLATAHCKIIGYNSSRGDNPTGTSRPLIDFGTAAWSFGTNWDWQYIQFAGSGSNSGLSTSSNSILYDVKATNTNTASSTSAALTLGTNSQCIRCEAICPRCRAIVSLGGATVYASYAHDSDVGYFTANTSGFSIINSIFDGNITKGVHISVNVTTPSWVMGNTFYGAENKQSVCLDFTTTNTTVVNIFNNIFYGCTTAASHALSGQTSTQENFNNFFNNTTNRTNITTGVNSIAVDSGFTGVAQLTGSTATTSGGVLTQSGGNFSSVTDNKDYLRIVSGTGVTAGYYLITSHTTTTATLSPAPTDNATADKVWQVTTGHDFKVGTNLKATATPSTFPGARSTNYQDTGALQRQEGTGGGNSVFIH